MREGKEGKVEAGQGRRRAKKGRESQVDLVNECKSKSKVNR